MGRMKCRLRGFLQRRCERDIIGPCVFQSPIVSDSYCLFQKSVLFLDISQGFFLFPRIQNRLRVRDEYFEGVTNTMNVGWEN